MVRTLLTNVLIFWLTVSWTRCILAVLLQHWIVPALQPTQDSINFKHDARLQIWHSPVWFWFTSTATAWKVCNLSSDTYLTRKGRLAGIPVWAEKGGVRKGTSSLFHYVDERLRVKMHYELLRIYLKLPHRVLMKSTYFAKIYRHSTGLGAENRL